jgi:hypothetical protein
LLVVALGGALALAAGAGTGPSPSPPATLKVADRPGEGPPISRGDCLKKAATAAADVKDHLQRATLLAAVAEAYHRAGDRAAADRLLGQAVEAGEQIEENTPLYSALWAIARVELKRGNGPAALKVAQKMEDRHRRENLVYFLVSDQARAGDVKGATEMARALTGDWKSNALVAIATAQAGAGRIAEAERTMTTLSDPLSKSIILAEIALAQARGGQRDRAKATLAESRRLWEKVIHPGGKTQPLANHALHQAECGDGGALKTFAESNLADDSTYRGPKAYIYWKLATLCARAGDDRAALKFAEGIKDVSDRFVTLQQLARAQAEAKDRARARATLDRARKLEAALPAGPTRDQRHHTAAEVEALLGDVKAALATARAAKEGRERAAALYAVAVLLPARDQPAARKILAEAARQCAADTESVAYPLDLIVRKLAAAGDARHALAIVQKQKTPHGRAVGLLCVVAGMADRAQKDRP